MLPQAREEVPEIEAAGLADALGRPDAPVVIDVREQSEWDEGHVPGAVHVPRGFLESRIAGVASHDQPIVLTCEAGNRSLLAAQMAEKDGISTAVFDLRTIMPYDWDGIAALVKKTNRVLVAHEDQLTCGFGAEIAARIGDELFDHLDAPVKRVAAMDCPVAYYPELEEEILPQTSDVLTAIRALAAY